MKKLILLFLLIIFIIPGCSKEEPPVPGDNDIVYVCTSNSAKTYHTHRECGSLKQCKEDVLEVTRKKARENERIVCMTCKKKDDETNQGNQKDTVK
jgi:hypothetical protein